MLQSLRRYQNYPPRSVALHQATSIGFRKLYVTSIAVDAEAATQRAMESARKTKSALMMNDGFVLLLVSLMVVANTRRRRACVNVRVLLVEIVDTRGGCIPSECVFACKRVPTLMAQEVTLFQMHLVYISNSSLRVLLVPTHTLLMSHQVCLPPKSTTAILILALVWLASVASVRLHVCLEVVGTLERLSTNVAGARCFLWRRVSTLRLAF